MVNALSNHHPSIDAFVFIMKDLHLKRITEKSLGVVELDDTLGNWWIPREIISKTTPGGSRSQESIRKW